MKSRPIPKEFPAPDGTVLTLMRSDGLARIHIVRRSDGCFWLDKQHVSYDEDDDVSWWNGSTSRPGGLYSDLEVAEREARAIPGFADATRTDLYRV